jgi:hypothetical protein
VSTGGWQANAFISFVIGSFFLLMDFGFQIEDIALI